MSKIDDFLFLVVESAPKRFIVETKGDDISGEDQEKDEYDEPATVPSHTSAAEVVKGKTGTRRRGRNRCFGGFCAEYYWD